MVLSITIHLSGKKVTFSIIRGFSSVGTKRCAFFFAFNSSFFSDIKLLAFENKPSVLFSNHSPQCLHFFASS